jgi:hypothetical protein
MRRLTLFLAAGLMVASTVVVPLLESSTASAATASYEAEAAANTLAGGATAAGCTGCSGARKVRFVGNGGTLQFNGVTAAAAGSATVAIGFVNGGTTARTAQLSVNGGAVTSISFGSTADWSTPGSKSVTVTLRAGSNTLKFGNPSGNGPDFDKVTVTTSGGSGGGAPTAAELLAKVTSCNQISNGRYRTDEETSATIAVCGKNGAVFWKADMDIDCDGQRTTQCNEDTDCCFLPDTAFHQSDGRPLNSAVLPYVVVPSSSSIWNYRNSGIDGGSVVAVIFNNQLLYAVVGDTGPTQIIGEASYSTANTLGIDPDPSTGGTDSGVTYIVFSGARVSQLENHGAAVTLGEQLARQFIDNN